MTDDLPRLEHKSEAAFEIPERQVPAEYRDLVEAAKDILPWLNASDDDEHHPAVDQFNAARFSIEKSRKHAERYFVLRDQRDRAIKRFREALRVLQVKAEE